jgi:hypothetical protein
MSKHLVRVLGAIAALCLGGPVFAVEAPDAEVNQSTGQIESVDVEIAGSGYDLRHTVDPGEGAPGASVLLTSAPENDLRPRMAITTGGAAWVVWWRDTTVDAVMCRGRDLAGAWQAERTLSAPGESSRNPQIALFGGNAWVAYELTTSEGIAVAAVAIDDTPDPFGRVLLGTSAFAGAVDTQIQSVSGHLWVSWVQDGTRVGWSELDPASNTWGTARFEPYGVSDGVAGARARIQTVVIGQ